jgi:hypothetical protein
MSQLTVPSNIIVSPVLDGDVSAGANIAASKLQQQRFIQTSFDLDRADTPVATHKTVCIASNSGTLKTFTCSLADTGTTTDVSFDLKVNGSSVLTAAVNITNSETDDQGYGGTITSTSISAGDVISIDLAVTTSTGALGPFAQVVFNETAVS